MILLQVPTDDTDEGGDLQKRTWALLPFVVVNTVLEEKMTYKLIESPIELTDDQLDMVAAAGGSLIDADVDVKNVLNENNVNVGVIQGENEQET
jgi:hypothetical protein